MLQACEMFILELTLRSWNHSEENKRRTLQRNDIAAAITRTDIFDFLVCTWFQACRQSVVEQLCKFVPCMIRTCWEHKGRIWMPKLSNNDLNAA